MSYQNDYVNDFNQAKTIDANGRLGADTATSASINEVFNTTAASPAALNQTGTLSASMNSYPNFPNPERFVENRNTRYII